MPSPIGHALAGMAIAWSSPRRFHSTTTSSASWRLTLLCVLLAALPDLDLLYPPIHRTITHSVPVGLLVTIISVTVTRWVTRHDAVGIGLMCGAAWSSHILLDWLGADFRTPRGIQAFWPFSDAWFIAGVDLFAETERRRPFSAAAVQRNLITAAREIAIVGPVVIALWWGRVRDPLRSRQSSP